MSYSDHTDFNHTQEKFYEILNMSFFENMVTII